MDDEPIHISESDGDGSISGNDMVEQELVEKIEKR